MNSMFQDGKCFYMTKHIGYLSVKDPVILCKLQKLHNIPAGSVQPQPSNLDYIQCQPTQVNNFMPANIATNPPVGFHQYPINYGQNTFQQDSSIPPWANAERDRCNAPRLYPTAGVAGNSNYQSFQPILPSAANRIYMQPSALAPLPASGEYQAPLSGHSTNYSKHRRVDRGNNLSNVEKDFMMQFNTMPQNGRIVG